MIFTSTTLLKPNDFPEDRPVWVAMSHPATTVGEITAIAEHIEFDDSTSTYRLRPIPSFDADDIFISPIIRSFPVTVHATIGGWISPLPIDDAVDVG
ncbi:MAG: hypothetical protein IPI64_05355 [Chloracidobacterium sp.]|nr:hypothetical protein [Chloracidobacterium sp.]